MWPSPKIAFALLSAHSLLASGSPVEGLSGDQHLEKRQSCPSTHTFGARETTVSPGYGTSLTVVNLIKGAYAGATSDPIAYPACGGQSSCGGVAYGASAAQGTTAVATAVNSLNQRCPTTQIVLGRGAQIMENALCGGSDTGSGITTSTPPITAAALNMIKAVTLMGSPRYVAGVSYNVGTCATQGFAPRPQGYTCASGAKIQNYCDSPDPYCCTGSDQATHQGYDTKYGQAALTFVRAKLSATTTTTAAATPVPTSGAGGSCSALWGQCGGQGWAEAACCASGSCKVANAYYSQCL
ncbi:cutinase-domain-containing protein [Lasiosphaeris hirsuta]|uniref:Cutinase-domain-containing protein n=1 Tax=Lasiosphaeris hirsuta TaxID=260670 RepID=A0AA40E4Y4_9PEZI|nr:cutinase-domain-containing protein [Lasiosphaeris hirsuta]